MGSSTKDYLPLVRDWVANGAKSPYIWSSTEMSKRIRKQSSDEALADPTFKLGVYFFERDEPFARGPGRRPRRYRARQLELPPAGLDLAPKDWRARSSAPNAARSATNPTMRRWISRDRTRRRPRGKYAARANQTPSPQSTQRRKPEGYFSAVSVGSALFLLYAWIRVVRLGNCERCGFRDQVARALLHRAGDSEPRVEAKRLDEFGGLGIRLELERLLGAFGHAGTASGPCNRAR